MKIIYQSNITKKKIKLKQETNQLIYVLVFLFASLKLFAQSTNKDSLNFSVQIIKIEQQLLNAIPTGDTTVWSKYLDKNFYIITEDGTGYNRQDFLATFGALPKGYSGYINIIKPHFVFKNNIAVIHYVSDEHEFIFGQALHTTYATEDNWLKTGISWQLIASQVFEIPQLPPAIKVNAATLKKYTGIYRLSDSITCTISIENDSLFIQKKGRAKETLFPETDNVFFRRHDTRGRKFFVEDEQGKMLLRERRNGEDVVWKRIKLLNE